MRLGLMIASFVALAIAAVTGWTRHVSATENPAASPLAATAPNTGTSVGCVEHAPAQQGGVSPVYASMPYGTSASQPVPEYASSEPPTAAQYESPSAYASGYDPAPPVLAPQYIAGAPAVQRTYVQRSYVAPHTRVVYSRHARHKRPFSHSAAIVAGTAAAGAGIGALAGGGRGAGIGALAGGGAGFVYDRLTH